MNALLDLLIEIEDNDVAVMVAVLVSFVDEVPFHSSITVAGGEVEFSF